MGYARALAMFKCSACVRRQSGLAVLSVENFELIKPQFKVHQTNFMPSIKKSINKNLKLNLCNDYALQKL